MKIKIVLVFFLVAISFLSCNDNDEINSPFNATVLREGNKCRTNNNPTSDFLIEFNEDYDTLLVENERIYYASNLPEEFKVEGLQIIITFRKPNYDNMNEILICDTSIGGDEYPQIWVISAE